MARIVVAGGGMCGMASAMMLADGGHDVVVLERDPAPPPPDPDVAFGGWDRRGVAQFGLAHWLHARGTTILRHQLPLAYRLLDDHGGYHFNIVKYLLGMQPDASTEPDDDRFDLVTGRRSTLEWAMATAAESHDGVAVRRGVGIAGLTATAPTGDAVPHVTGVRLESGEELAADLVVDATGRRSPTPGWLADIGALPPQEEAEDSGFAYYGRYFASADGTVPPLLAPALSPIGSFSVLTLPADNGTWSVTLYAMSADRPLRKFRDPDVHERVLRACPAHAHWLDGTAISDMASMAGVVDRYRRFVVDGRPCATGILTVGDASSCTNPSLGRGITLGLMHVEVLNEAVANHLDDPTGMALAYDEATESRVRPWHDATVEMDRRRVRDMRAYAQGAVPEVDPTSQIADLLIAGARTDPTATRAFGEVFSCWAMVDEVFARPGVLEHVLGLGDRVTPSLIPGPDREQLVELVG